MKKLFLIIGLLVVGLFNSFGEVYYYSNEEIDAISTDDYKFSFGCASTTFSEIKEFISSTEEVASQYCTVPTPNNSKYNYFLFNLTNKDFPLPFFYLYEKVGDNVVKGHVLVPSY